MILTITDNTTITTKHFSFYGAYKHFSLRLKERFDIDITYEDFVEKYVLKRTLPKKYTNKKVKYLYDNKIFVYHILKYFEVPITIYELNRINKNKVLKTIVHDN